MIDRISTSLFHPKLIIKFLNDKIWKILLYFLFLVIMAALPSVLQVCTSRDKISFSSERIMLNNIAKSEKTYDIAFSGGSLIGEDVVYFEGSHFYIAFNEAIVDAKNDKPVYELRSDRITLCQGKEIITSVSYEKLKAKDFSFSGIKDGNIDDMINLCNILDNAYSHEYKKLLPYSILYLFLETISILAMLCLLLFFVSSMANPKIIPLFRFKIVVYCLTTASIWTLVAGLSGLTWISYIGIFISSIFVINVMRSIVAIEVRK